MKLAVMSDIHSNKIAFDACLSYIEENPPDGIVLLGDYVSDCPQPQATLERLHKLREEYPLFMIRGNREEYFLRYRAGLEKDWNCSSYKGSLLYTYERLSEEDLDWFESLPPTGMLSFEGMESIRLAHGSPFSTKELLDEGKDNTNTCLDKLDANYMLAGHTHRQMIYKYNGKVLINPGSVGVAIGAASTAHMAYLNWENGVWNHEFLSIPFSLEKVKRWFLKSELFSMANIWPKCILKSMEVGENMGPLCACLAHDMACEEGALEDNNVSESYWEKAALELKIIEV